MPLRDCNPPGIIPIRNSVPIDEQEQVKAIIPWCSEVNREACRSYISAPVQVWLMQPGRGIATAIKKERRYVEWKRW